MCVCVCEPARPREVPSWWRSGARARAGGERRGCPAPAPCKICMCLSGPCASGARALGRARAWVERGRGVEVGRQDSARGEDCSSWSLLSSVVPSRAQPTGRVPNTCASQGSREQKSSSAKAPDLTGEWSHSVSQRPNLLHLALRTTRVLAFSMAGSASQTTSIRFSVVFCQVRRSGDCNVGVQVPQHCARCRAAGASRLSLACGAASRLARPHHPTCALLRRTPRPPDVCVSQCVSLAERAPTCVCARRRGAQRTWR